MFADSKRCEQWNDFWIVLEWNKQLKAYKNCIDDACKCFGGDLKLKRMLL